MGDVQMNPDGMKTLSGHYNSAVSAAKAMKTDVETMRNLMANLYDGQIKDPLNTCFTKLESQLRLIQDSCEAIKNHIDTTVTTFTSGDVNAAGRADKAVDYSSAGAGNEKEK